MSNGPTPANWYPPAGAPPGYRPAAPPGDVMGKRFNVLGTVGLVLGIVDICYGVWKLASAALTGVIIQAERAFFGSYSAAAATPMSGMLSAVEQFSRRIALWEAVRAVPFMVASGFLIAIALRIRRGERQALFTARTWVWWAFGVVALSALLQVLVTIPATLDYQRQISGMMPTIPTTGRGAAPFDVKQMTDTWMMASTLMGLMMGTAFFATWPIAFRVWVDRLIVQSAPPEGGYQ